MAEPPSGWNSPNDPDPEPAAPSPFSSPHPASGWNAPAAGQAGQAGQQPPAWGMPPAGPPPAPVQQPWGAPPVSPQPWGAPPSWGGPPPQGAWAGPGNFTAGAARTPGIIPFRPLAIGEILDGAIRAIRSNPRTMVGFSAIVIAVLALIATAPQALLLSTLQNSPLTDPSGTQRIESSDVAALIGAGGLSLLVNVLEYVLATTTVSALLIVAVDGAVRGQTLHPGQLWKRVRPRIFAVIGLAIVVPLVMPFVVLLALLPGLIVIFIPGGSALTVIGVLLLVVGGLIGIAGCLALYLSFWAVAAPALLLEQIGVFASLARSFRLVRGSFWRVLGIGLLTALITSIIRQLFVLPFGLIGALLSSTQDSDSFAGSLIQLLVSDVGTILAGAVLYPFAAGVSALLYLDLRMRREGLDVDLMRQ